MCGIAGFITNKKYSNNELVNAVSIMSDEIFYRGPDSNGVWTDNNKGIALSHRRLSVLDVSCAGHQPMVSNTGRYVLTFNGEIYNHNSLRKRIGSGHLWKGRSDTETLLAAFEVWGIKRTLIDCEGMFAFAVWDRKKSTLIMSRDKLGEKPLYYGWQSNTFMFASDLNALKKHIDFIGNIDREALSLFVQYNYIPAPYSIYSGIKKIMPGEIISMPLDSMKIKEEFYWNLDEVVKTSISDKFTGSFDYAVETLDNVLSNAVKKQMISDVSIGAFLSGGIDSSAIVSLMQKNSMNKVKTFTIGFNEKHHDEATYAKEIAAHLGTDHTELYVTSQHALEVIPKLHSIYSEPFADSSQIPTFLIGQLAKKDVTVSLSGDGGDELFAGYNRYILSDKLWNGISRVPIHIRNIISNIMLNINPRYYQKLNNLSHSNSLFSNLGYKLQKGSSLLNLKSEEELYMQFVSSWLDESSIVIGVDSALKTNNLSNLLDNESFIHKMMLMDMKTYLPDDILCKVDRASMYNSLETRMPFLDKSVIEFAWSLPMDMKIHSSGGKKVLREMLYNYVPKKMMERPKTGFSIPLAEWLRSDLRDWAEYLISRIENEDFFHFQPIQKKWNEHLSGKKDWSHSLWSILVFQDWHENNKRK
jgi:asparagine synthase (glutamine-hydrolysing)